METNTLSKQHAFSGRVLFYVFLVLVTLLPFFFIPSALVTLTAAKGLLFLGGVALITIVWILFVLKEGTLTLPKTWLLSTLLIVGAIYLISSLFSGQANVSFVGEGFATDTFISVIAGILIVMLLPNIVRSKRELLKLYGAVGIGFVVIALVQLVHLLSGFGDTTIFSSPITNLLGNWSDLGIFAGLIVILTTLTIEFLSVKPLTRGLLYLALLLSLFFVALVEFTPVWYIIGILSLVLLVYQLSFSAGSHSKHRKISPLVLVMLLISLLFIFAGGLIGDSLSDLFNTGQVQVRPSWEATSQVALDVLKEGSVLGVGPNRFSEAWFMYKPSGVNQTLFWATPFRSGIGFIPTTAVTTGILGLVAWILFLGSLLILGVKSVFRPNQDSTSRYIVMSSFLTSLYLWIFLVIYTPGIVLFALAFVFTGLFISSLYIDKAIGKLLFSFSKHPTSNFAGALAGIIALIVVGAGAYITATQFAGGVFQQKGVVLASEGDIDGAERAVANALRTNEQARFYNTLTDIQTFQLNTLLQRDDIAPDILREQFQSVLATTIANAQRATTVGGDNYLNWITLGNIYEDLVPLGIEGSYESSKDAYMEAKTRNPSGPDVALSLARLESRNGNNEAARQHIVEALTLKQNYTDAVFLLSQIEIAEGNVSQAITSVEAATILEPNNSAIFFQLGLLRYSTNDYVGAAAAFERAVIINRVYANAKYFLGLSYYQLGRTEEALAQFEDVQQLNPDNEEVAFILNNLRKGEAPFANVAPPLDDTPELREEPPAEEPIVETEE